MLLSSQSREELSFLVEKQKRRTQTANGTSRTDNVDKDKLSDTHECEPFVEPKAKEARRNFQSFYGEEKRKGEFSRKTLDPTN